MLKNTGRAADRKNIEENFRRKEAEL